MVTERELHEVFDGVASSGTLPGLCALRASAVSSRLLPVFRQRLLQAIESGELRGAALGGYRLRYDVVCAWLARKSGCIGSYMKKIIVRCMRPSVSESDLLSASWADDGDGIEFPVTVIVPVYNGYNALVRLTDTLFMHTDARHSVLFIDDASTDSRVSALLAKLARKYSNVKVMNNPVNLGFAGTVNRGAAACVGDFVLLNTDTEVPPGWIPRLFAPIWKCRNTASVTPLTCESAFLAVPDAETGTVEFVEKHGTLVIDRTVSRIRPDLRWDEIEAGVGFCLAISRSAWDKVGGFDAEVFGRGYGEETDWCLRARYRHGLVNRFAENLFVAHWHTASFTSEEKATLMRRNHARIKARNPRWRNEPASGEKASLRRMWRLVRMVCELDGLIPG